MFKAYQKKLRLRRILSTNHALAAAHEYGLIQHSTSHNRNIFHLSVCIGFAVPASTPLNSKTQGIAVKRASNLLCTFEYCDHVQTLQT